MRYRCKCGRGDPSGAMGPRQCARCPKCGSDFAEAPDKHRDPRPHWIVRTKVVIGSKDIPMAVCLWCGEPAEKLQARGEAMEA